MLPVSMGRTKDEHEQEHEQEQEQEQEQEWKTRIEALNTYRHHCFRDGARQDVGRASADLIGKNFWPKLIWSTK
jgi:hypothetical protein